MRYNYRHRLNVPAPKPTLYIPVKPTGSATPLFSKLEESVKNYSAADNIVLVKTLFQKLNLTQYWLYFKASARFINPDSYHSFDHSYMTALNCFEGASWGSLSLDETRAIVVAGLYHDISHSQGHFGDAYNIQQSIDIFTDCNGKVQEHERLTALQFKHVVKAIKDSQYPYIVQKKKGSLSTLSKILRDADRMVAYSSNQEHLMKMIRALMAEINYQQTRRYGDYIPMTVEEFCQQQTTFYSTIEWFTLWGKNKAVVKNWPELNKRMIMRLKENETFK